MLVYLCGLTQGKPEVAGKPPTGMTINCMYQPKFETFYFIEVLAISSK